ncbi:MAG: alpha/beta fold hydrolase [Candidatus Eremiobacteraeota bacterium]|nr:alpha/beta fold hydrolase [Candidatus Eremiobacteraeota bacterium]
MRLDLLELSTRSGDRIAALDYEPRRARGVTLAVAHGYSSSKQNLDALCAFLASHGFRSISIDFPGHKLGGSGGRLSSPGDLTDALAAAVRFAQTTYGDPVYTVGHSMGAMTALRTCAEDPAVAGAVSIATGYGRPAALTALGVRGAVDLRSAYVDGLTLQDVVAETEPLVDAALARLAGRPVLYVAAERDGMISRASARELFDRAPEPKTFVTIDSDHTNAGEASRAVVLAWLGERHPR